MIRIGPAGWSYADWEGIVVPRKKPRSFHALAHLARFVSCVEVNSSFYAVPRAVNAARWAKLVSTADDFRFVAKLWGAFTHEPLPPGSAPLEAGAAAWLDGVEPLRASGKLACILVQFPHSFHASSAAYERLDRIEGTFGHLRPVLEVRHRSWYEPDALRRIERLGWSLARIDLPPARDHPPSDAPTLGPIGYLRVHGRNAETWFDARAGRDERYDYLYSPEEIGELARTARELEARHDETFVITNNHFRGQAMANALELLAELSGTRPPAPTELVEAFPHLSGVTTPSGQATLFG